MVTSETCWIQGPARATSLGLCLLAVFSCPPTGGAGHTPSEMLGMMMDSLSFPLNASMALRVELNGTWHNAPAAAPYSGTQVDLWRISSDMDRYGREMRREAPDGNSHMRLVFHGDEQWTFHFDTSAPPDAEIVGRMAIRSHSNRTSRWRMPIAEYFDPLLRFPRRFFDYYDTLDVAQTMELVDGHSCYVIDGAWDGREFRLWLDPEFGFLPRKYELQSLHMSEQYLGSRGVTGLVDQRFPGPPEFQNLLGAPIQSEERLSSVVLEQKGGRSYIAGASLEKKRTYADDVFYTERLTFQTREFTLTVASDSDAFLSFADLLSDGTPAEETVGGGYVPVVVNHYVFKDGELVSASAGIGAYFCDLWSAVLELASDFSIENLRRLDSVLLVVVCTAAALLINVTMAYRAYRKKPSKRQEPEQPT